MTSPNADPPAADLHDTTPEELFNPQIISRNELGIAQALQGLDIDLRVNIRTSAWEINDAGGGWEPFDRYELAKLRQVIARTFRFPKDKPAQFARDEWKNLLEAHLQLHKVDPFRNDFLSPLSNEWDGKPRIDYWLSEYLGADNTPLNRAVAKAIICNICRRAYFPGCQVDIMPILIGPQGIGKSTSLKALLPPGYFSDSLDFSLRTNRERMESVGQAALAEIPELNGISGQRARAFKAFITQTAFFHRDAYAQGSENHPPRHILIGTSNADGGGIIPNDPTGYRRFPVVHCYPIPGGQPAIVKGIAKNRDQLFAEAMAYINPANPNYDPTAWLIPDELITEMESLAQQVSDYDDALADKINNLHFTHPVIIGDIIAELGFISDQKTQNWIKPYLISEGWTPPERATKLNGIVGRYWTPPAPDSG